MSIVFMGYQTWGLVSLKCLVEAGYEITLVATHPNSLDRSTASYAESVADFASELGIPTMVTSRGECAELVSAMQGIQPDLVVSSNWRRVIPAAISECARLGAINVHRSLLPQYGGFSPINWAIARGESETGVTVHRVSEELDAGEIFAQERIEIGCDDTAAEIFSKSNDVIMKILPSVVSGIMAGTLRGKPQDLEQATFYHKRLPRDNKIRWEMTAREVHNLIRAQSDPFPNAFTSHRRRRLYVKSSLLGPAKFRGYPGRLIARLGQGVVVLCGGGAGESTYSIVLTRVQYEGDSVRAATEVFSTLDTCLGG